GQFDRPPMSQRVEIRSYQTQLFGEQVEWAHPRHRVSGRHSDDHHRPAPPGQGNTLLEGFHHAGTLEDDIRSARTRSAWPGYRRHEIAQAGIVAGGGPRSLGQRSARGLPGHQHHGCRPRERGEPGQHLSDYPTAQHHHSHSWADLRPVEGAEAAGQRLTERPPGRRHAVGQWVCLAFRDDYEFGQTTIQIHPQRHPGWAQARFAATTVGTDSTGDIRIDRYPGSWSKPTALSHRRHRAGEFMARNERERGRVFAPVDMAVGPAYAACLDPYEYFAARWGRWLSLHHPHAPDRL